MLLYTKHTQALERCTNSKEEKEVVQKGLSHTSEYRHGAVHPGAYPAPSGMASGVPPAPLLPLKQVFIKKNRTNILGI